MGNAKTTAGQDEVDQIVTVECDDDSVVRVAPERRPVRTKRSDMTVFGMREWQKRNELILRPFFQRDFVWDKGKASKLIESLLLDVPLPVIYLAELPEGERCVVDGQQRLTSIFAYLDGTFPYSGPFQLVELELLPELNGKTFVELTLLQRRTIEQAILSIVTVLQENDSTVKFELFQRLNQGSAALNAQELRNCVYHGRYNDLLSELANDETLLKIRHADQPHRRMNDRELILRFFAMWRSTHLKYKNPMNAFLNQEMERHRNPTDGELIEMKAVFRKAIDISWSIFGPNAFRRFRVGAVGKHGGGSWTN